jgi:fibulin 1/2
VTCSQECINTPGSFKCGCQSGYRLSADGITCVPLLACAETNACQTGCIRVNGTDTCTCNPGYQLNDDGTTCSDVNECTEGTATCDPVQGICTNTEGSFTCACNNSYTVGPNNECDGEETIGSFYKVYRLTCGGSRAHSDVIF